MPDGGIAYYWLGAAGENRLLRYDDPDPEFVALHEALWEMGESEGGRAAVRAGANGRYTESVRTYLDKEGTPPRMMALADAGYANTAGGAVEAISLGHTIDCEAHWSANDGEHDYRTRMSEIVAALAQGLVLQTRAPVAAVRLLTDESRAGVEVQLRPSGGASSGAEVEQQEGGDGEVLRARKAVLAVAITALQQSDIMFSPPLPPEKLAAASRIQISPGCKVVLKFSARFWPADCHGIICSGCFVPEFWMNTVEGIGSDMHAPKSAGVVEAASVRAGASAASFGAGAASATPERVYHYVTAFAMGAMAERLCAQPVAQTIAKILAQLDEVFCNAATAPLAADAGARPADTYMGAMLVDWAKEPFARGAYSCPTVTEPPGARAELAMPVGGTLFFAGEATNHVSMMTAHGALESGLRAADEVLCSMKRSAL